MIMKIKMTLPHSLVFGHLPYIITRGKPRFFIINSTKKLPIEIINRKLSIRNNNNDQNKITAQILLINTLWTKFTPEKYRIFNTTTKKYQ